MNERIKELAVQAELPLLDVDGNCKYGDTYFSKEKFAELIVRECAGVDLYWLSEQDRKAVAEKMKQHFGVEE
jgi:hypothetical protein